MATAWFRGRKSPPRFPQRGTRRARRHDIGMGAGADAERRAKHSTSEGPIRAAYPSALSHSN
jgi:hypothetical protein